MSEKHSWLYPILTRKRARLEASKRLTSFAQLQEEAQSAPPCRSLRESLATPHLALIAEIKRASPSRGAIMLDLDAVALAQAYERGGAAAISVITEEDYFRGRPQDLMQVKQATALPVLCKDFITDPYQIYQARARGADAVLLIVRCLAFSCLRHLSDTARQLGMEALIEVNCPEEARLAMDAGARVIGINNRDLATFTIDLGITERVSALIPKDFLIVSESGIQSRRDARRVMEAGARGILVGEALVRAYRAGQRVGAVIRELIGHPQEGGKDVCPCSSKSVG